jgi:U3 small nucleolar RNA-associated protein 19
MNKSIIPLLENPFLLNDFITQSFSKGGDLAVLSMDSLYTLIIRYNLSYPNFYEKLYGIIAEDVFNQSRYSGQFKRLVHRFLSSTHLPEYIVASFIKKLARLTLFVPPHAILFILPLIYHLISEHSELKVLIHRMDEYKKMQEGPLLLANEEMEVFKGNDPFLFDELDLKKTNAMDSTLWEIDSLDLHWNPMVSKMAQTFRSNMKEAKPGFKIYDFLQIDYKSLFDEETQVESSSEMEYDKTGKFEFNKLIF